MASDCFGVLAVASNILLFLDFVDSVISECSDADSTSSESSTTLPSISLVVPDLKRHSLKLLAGSGAAVATDLDKLATSCRSFAEELLATIERLHGSGLPENWNALITALNASWSSRKGETVGSRSSSLKTLGIQHLAVFVHDQYSSIDHTVSNLQDYNRRIEATEARDLQELWTSLRHENESLQSLDISKVSLARPATVLSDLIAEVRTSEQRLLDTLYFRSLKVRHEQIATAHKKTFNWIFDRSHRSDGAGNAEPRFLDWLTNGNGFYWIAGRPGSGKSTLMKFLSDDPRTIRALKDWAGSDTLVTASFFFWIAGTEMQKSQDGLLRSLLYQLLNKARYLIPEICGQLKSKDSGIQENSSVTWTRARLVHCLRHVTSSGLPNLKFCYFIDGLDEYSGNHTEIIEPFLGLAKSKNLKLCLSSRPWDVFENAFGHGQFNKLYLQDLTMEDIRHYVVDNLEGHSRLPRGQSELVELAKDLVTKAQGVFLWVHLAVRSLAEGVGRSESFTALERRLAEFPPDLDSYFRTILDSIESHHQTESAEVLQEALTASEPLCLMMYPLMNDSSISDPELGRFEQSEIHFEHKNGRDYINSRSRGLLEINTDVTADLMFRYRVDFLHRTARDFLQSSEMQDMLHSKFDQDFDVSLKICQAIMAMLRRMPLPKRTSPGRDQPPLELLDNLCFQIRRLRASAESSSIVVHLLVSAQEWLDEYTLKRKIPPGCPQSVVEFATEYGLTPYVNFVLTKQTPRHDKEKVATHLLRSALRSKTSRKYRIDLDSGIVGTLFEAGAVMNENAWDDLVRLLFSGLTDYDRSSALELVGKILLYCGKDSLLRPCRLASVASEWGYKSRASAEDVLTFRNILDTVFSSEQVKSVVEPQSSTIT